MKADDGKVVTHDHFAVGIYLADSYLHHAETFQVLTWLGPRNIFHPNIRAPYVCLGERFFRPGTPLVQIIYQLHAVITYRKWASNAGLNPDACQWAINNTHMFPADPRPLKRRTLNVELELATAPGK